jgi:hypothetical protein
MTGRHTILSLVLSLAAAASAADRQGFDHLVRNDYFAGFAGNREALERAMAKTTVVLADNPKHAEAMVWHGTGLFFQAGEAFRTGNREKGMELYGKGVGMMDAAVALAPRNVGVRIPRGAVLLQASLSMQEAMAKPLIEKGLSDYLAAYEIQKAELDALGEHPKGELLFGIADAHRRLGNNEGAEQFFGMIVKAMPGTNYAKRAEIWMNTKTLTPAQVRCVGCHVSSR